MKVIISRKGFDSASGGMASPIMPDGTMLSMPIPIDFPDFFGDYGHLFCNGKSYSRILEELSLGKDSNKYTWCHLDPDIRMNNREELPQGWKAVFGQCDAAETHLENQGVKEGDLFLFFGWFKETENVNGAIKYKRGVKDVHAFFGYLQVGEIVRGKDVETYYWHPHSSFYDPNKPGNNTMYVAADELIIEGKRTGLPGFGTFKYSDQLVLTWPGMVKSRWKLPEFFRDVTISYHDENSFKPEGYFQCVGRGQEFVVSEDAKVTNWAKELITNNYDDMKMA